MDDNEQILKEIIMKVMGSVDNLAIQVAELNTLLKEGVLNDITALKQRANRHRNEINEMDKRLKTLESHEKYVICTLGLLGTILSTIIVPILLALL